VLSLLELIVGDVETLQGMQFRLLLADALQSIQSRIHSQQQNEG